jgi:uncharacterized damage-inducible protein DinB
MWKDQFVALAKYNRRMNEKLYTSAGKLSVEDLRKDRSAFFKSIWGTLHHILAADLIWLRRYQNIPGTKSVLSALDTFPPVMSFEPTLYTDLSSLFEARKKLDGVITAFVESLDDSLLNEILKYKNMSGKEHENKLWILFTHFFNHQTHHRGQTTTLLTQAGQDVGCTDFPVVICE